MCCLFSEVFLFSSIFSFRSTPGPPVNLENLQARVGQLLTDKNPQVKKINAVFTEVEKFINSGNEFEANSLAGLEKLKESLVSVGSHCLGKSNSTVSIRSYLEGKIAWLIPSFLKLQLGSVPSQSGKENKWTFLNTRAQKIITGIGAKIAKLTPLPLELERNSINNVPIREVDHGALTGRVNPVIESIGRVSKGASNLFSRVLGRSQNQGWDLATKEVLFSAGETLKEKIEEPLPATKGPVEVPQNPKESPLKEATDKGGVKTVSGIKEVLQEAMGGQQDESLQIFQDFFLNLLGLSGLQDGKQELTRNGEQTYTLQRPASKKEGISGSEVVDKLSLGRVAKMSVGTQKATIEFPSSLSFTVSRQKDVVTISLNEIGSNRKKSDQNIVLKMGVVNAKIASLSYDMKTKKMKLATLAMLVEKDPNIAELDVSKGSDAPAFKLFQDIHTNPVYNKTSN